MREKCGRPLHSLFRSNGKHVRKIMLYDTEANKYSTITLCQKAIDNDNAESPPTTRLKTNTPDKLKPKELTYSPPKLTPITLPERCCNCSSNSGCVTNCCSCFMKFKQCTNCIGRRCKSNSKTLESIAIIKKNKSTETVSPLKESQQTPKNASSNNTTTSELENTKTTKKSQPSSTTLLVNKTAPSDPPPS